MASGTVVSPVKFIQRLSRYETEKPFQILVPIPTDAEDQRLTNIEFETKEQTFIDIRPQMEDFTLDQNDFEIVSMPTSLQFEEATDQDAIKTKYLPKVKKLLRDTVSGEFNHVHFFDWRLRDSQVPDGPQTVDINDLSRWLLPIGYIHINKRLQQPSTSIVTRVKLLLGDEADSLLRGRVRVINVWRPLEHPVEDYPLAFCDASTLSNEDLVECDHVRRKYKGAILYPCFNTEQRFYYLAAQTPDEVAVLKIFDSDPDVKAKVCAHCSFCHPFRTDTSKARKSLEVRTLVFNYPKTSDELA